MNATLHANALIIMQCVCVCVNVFCVSVSVCQHVIDRPNHSCNDLGKKNMGLLKTCQIVFLLARRKLQEDQRCMKIVDLKHDE